MCNLIYMGIKSTLPTCIGLTQRSYYVPTYLPSDRRLD